MRRPARTRPQPATPAHTPGTPPGLVRSPAAGAAPRWVRFPSGRTIVLLFPRAVCLHLPFFFPLSFSVIANLCNYTTSPHNHTRGSLFVYVYLSPCVPVLLGICVFCACAFLAAASGINGGGGPGTLFWVCACVFAAQAVPPGLIPIARRAMPHAGRASHQDHPHKGGHAYDGTEVRDLQLRSIAA